MKPKNVMLLGFVNKAVEYLDEHMDDESDTRLNELKNIDLIALRDELGEDLGLSLGTMQSTMTTLLKAGNEAFDVFVEENIGNKNIADQFNKIFDVDFNETKQSEDLNDLISYYNLQNDVDEYEIQDLKPVEDELLEQIKKNTTKDNTQVTSPVDKRNTANEEELDSIFDEIVENETNNEEIELKEDRKSLVEQIKNELREELKKEILEEKNIDNEVDNLNVQVTNQSYVSSLIEDLKKQLDKEEAEKKVKDDKFNDVYNKIIDVYKYLPIGFVRSVYELKESIASEYPLGKKVIVLHRISFDNVDNLRKLVEIGLNHGYSINADENKKIVDIFKQFENSDGKILTNIYEIANQGYLLNGTYEGYRVMISED